MAKDQRDQRLWQNGLAHSLITEGDQAECDKWLGWARQKLQFMLANLPGAVSQIFEPVDGIQIDIYTRPNRIRIKAEGGVLVTVMDKLSAISNYPNGNNAPFQARKSRYFYLVTDSVSKRDDYYAGGVAMDLTKPDYDPNAESARGNKLINPKFYGDIVKTGGSWYSTKTALSWVNETNQVTLFFDGLFKVITFPAATGWALHTACLGGVGWIQDRFPAITQVYDYTFICIFKFNANPIQYHVYQYAYKVSTNTLTLLANSALVNLGVDDQVTAFTEDAHALAYTVLTIANAQDARGSTQAVKKVVFTDNYSGFTTTEIYNQLVPVDVSTKDIVYVNVDANTRTRTTDETLAIHEAGYFISYLRVENKHFTFLRHRLESLQRAYNEVVTRITSGSTSYTVTWSETRSESWRHQIGTIRPDQNGVYQVAVVDDWIGQNQDNITGSGGYDGGNGSDTYSRDVRFNRALFVSAFPPTCLLEERRFTDNGSSSYTATFNPTAISNTYAKEWHLVLRKKQATTNAMENIELLADSVTYAPVFSPGQFVTPIFGIEIHNTDYDLATSNEARTYFTLNYSSASFLKRYDPLAYSDKFMMYCFTQPVQWVATHPKTLKLDIKTGSYTLENGRMDAPTGSLYTSPIGVSN